jgi:hypothetical protein
MRCNPEVARGSTDRQRPGPDDAPNALSQALKLSLRVESEAVMVLIRKDNGQWHEPKTSAYCNEKELQDLLKLSPHLLPPEIPLAIVDEFSIPGIGSADLVGVNSSGDITIVECKLHSNSEIRREVVGQLMAYASGLWRMTYDNFAAIFEQRAKRSLAQSIEDLNEGPVDEPEFRNAVANRLETGEFRLVIAVDDITPELKTIVEFLNAHTLPTVQVLALALEYGREEDTEFLTPTIYGEESARFRNLGTTNAHWNETTFGEQVAALADGQIREFVSKLLTHGSQHGHHPFYGSGTTPGMSYYYDLGGQPRSVWALYLNTPTPKVSLNFGNISKWSEAAVKEMLEELRINDLLASRLQSVNSDDLNRYPTIPVSPVLVNAETQSTFFKAIDSLLGRTSAEQ